MRTRSSLGWQVIAIVVFAGLVAAGCGEDTTVVGPAGVDAKAKDVAADTAGVVDGGATSDVAAKTDVPVADVPVAVDTSAADSAAADDTKAGDGGPTDAPDPDDVADDAEDAADPGCTMDTDCDDAPILLEPCHELVCTDGKCVAAPVPDGGECEDGNPCSAGEQCTGGKCAGGGSADCDDGDVCTDDSCDPAKGCGHTANSAACDDGDACTSGDACGAGKCVGGGAVDCDDKNPCSTDSCVAATGCAHADNSAPCDDGDACTGGDTCAGGKCASGPTVGCNDGNPCTDDSCKAETGCVHAPNTAPCDDGSPCTVLDTCADGKCAKGKTKGCDDGNPCTDDGCDEVKGCISAPNTAPCSDGNACTVKDVCAAGACVPGKAPDCDDGKPCTTDHCQPASGCKNSNNTLPCDDGNACTSGDVCAAGACKPGKAPDCADGNPCTDDICDKKTGCAHANNNKPCDDGNKCTLADHCKAGSCVPGKAPECDDGNPCTKPTCDPGQGCKNVPNTLPCNDGDKCTSGDTCKGGACTSGAKISCSDGNACTVDSCAKAAGCVFLPATATCTDGNACTLGDVCKDSACATGPPATCDDKNPCTTDLCLPASGCTSKPNNLPCDDGSVCTAGDICSAGACKAGKALPCADGNLCTDDGCDQKTGCVFLPNAVTCSDGNACSTGDACSKGSCAGKPLKCDDGNGCTLNYCDAGAGCKAVAKPGPCSDGTVCTTGDTCIAGKCEGKAIDCDDGNPCSKDSCDAAKGCQHGMLDGVKCGAAGLCKKGQCIAGTKDHPATSCSELRDLKTGAKTGLHWIDPDGKGGKGAPYQVVCDMGHDGGGWTLVAVSSSDGQNNWTWNNRTYWTTNTKTFGSPTAANKDLKSPAYHVLPVQEVLFIHRPSQVWTTYLVGDGKSTLAAILTAFGGPKCLDPAKDGFAKVAGNLKVAGKLCNDKLYWSPLDKDGSANCGDNEHTYGPAFNGRDNSVSCHFDDPGTSGGLGPLFNNGNLEYPALGFGRALGLNTGKANAAENYIQVYVRLVPPPGCGNGKLEKGEACDDGNQASGDGCAKDCTVEVYGSCKALAKGAPAGLYMIDSDGVGKQAPYATRCETTLDGGGWTLVAVSSDDGKHTWTWNNRTYWTTNKAIFGSADSLHKDFKVSALHDLKFTDVLFVHAPSSVWAAYHKVGDGKASLAEHINKIGGPVCHKAGTGTPVSAGTLKVGGNLCETRLYFNAHDHDGKPTACGDNDAGWGPAWSAKNNNPCPFDDPGATSGLGPIVGSGGSERPSVGFGWGLGLNKGAAGTGQNHMKVYVR